MSEPTVTWGLAAPRREPAFIPYRPERVPELEMLRRAWAYVPFPVGYPSGEARVPNLRRKPLDEIALWNPRPG